MRSVCVFVALLTWERRSTRKGSGVARPGESGAGWFTGNFAPIRVISLFVVFVVSGIAYIKIGCGVGFDESKCFRSFRMWVCTYAIIVWVHLIWLLDSERNVDFTQVCWSCLPNIKLVNRFYPLNLSVAKPWYEHTMNCIQGVCDIKSRLYNKQNTFSSSIFNGHRFWLRFIPNSGWGFDLAGPESRPTRVEPFDRFYL